MAQAQDVEAQVIIPRGAEWAYQLDPESAPTEMSRLQFSTSDWPSGRAGFGYGDDDDATRLSMRGKHTRLAIREMFELDDAVDPKRLRLAVRYDDGIEVWLNGHHLLDRSLVRRGGKVVEVKDHEADEREEIPLGEFARYLRPEGNCLLIIGHNSSLQSSDFTLDPVLFAGEASSLRKMERTQAAALIPEGFALADKFRLVWTQDPAITAVVCWNQVSGGPGVVRYGPEDRQREADRYPSTAEVRRTVDQDPMLTCIAWLEGLSADTEYFFCIQDEKGVSRRFRFRTAPVVPQSFTFVAGGDSRNGRGVRVRANQTVARLRPLFVAFTGDLVSRDTNERWGWWLDDWQHTISEDGTMIPLVPHRGNHEREPRSMHDTFGVPEDAYYAFSVGGDLFRYFVLNSQISAGGEQGKWLERELKRHRRRTTHLVAGYHKPMRPHVGEKDEGANPLRWAKMFYEHGVDLAIESDSHVMKRTAALRPDKKGDEGFSATGSGDRNATVFIGEGCWGAPLRATDDSKDWTLASGSFNGFDWIHVTPDEMKIRTVVVGPTEDIAQVNPDDPFVSPEGLRVWQPDSGEILVVPGDR
ncbi:MAG: metallophosphoesterase family protein [Planctomycetota bacterium]